MRNAPSGHSRARHEQQGRRRGGVAPAFMGDSEVPTVSVASDGVQLMNPVVPLALETPRLRLRVFEEHDCDALHEMFGDETCVRYTIEQPVAPWQTWRALAAPSDIGSSVRTDLTRLWKGRRA